MPNVQSARPIAVKKGKTHHAGKKEPLVGLAAAAARCMVGGAGGGYWRRRALPTAARRYRGLWGRRRCLPGLQRCADAQPGDGLARGARTRLHGLVGVAGSVGLGWTTTLATLLVTLACTNSIRRCARLRRASSCASEAEGNKGLTEFERRR